MSKWFPCFVFYCTTSAETAAAAALRHNRCKALWRQLGQNTCAAKQRYTYLLHYVGCTYFTCIMTSAYLHCLPDLNCIKSALSWPRHRGALYYYAFLDFLVNVSVLRCSILAIFVVFEFSPYVIQIDSRRKQKLRIFLFKCMRKDFKTLYA
jgi:hypothetical protein